MRMEGDHDDHDVYSDGDEDLIAYEEGDDHDVYVDDNVYGDHDEDLISFEEAHNKCGWKGQIVSNIWREAFKPELRKPT